MIAWVLLYAILGMAIFWFRPAPLKSSHGINLLEKVELGGVDQWISIRGADTGQPVLLFLHGGPGSANLAKLRIQTPDLEQHFVVVNWDQRGAGKSAGLFTKYGELSIEQMVSDAHELIAHLKTRFGVEKIYLMGFSWGGILGLELAARFPEDLYATISVSQEIYPLEAEKLSLEYVRGVALDTGNTQAINELAGIDPTYRGADWLRQLNTQRKWLLQFGGVYHTTDSYSHELWMMLRAPEYSLFDVALWPLGSARSLEQLWPEVMAVNFFESVPEIHVPVYFFVGRYDQNCPPQVTVRYFEQLTAPAGKHMVWFENSAHDPFFDEPDRMVQELIKVIGDEK